jgi:hypothetical protein
MALLTINKAISIIIITLVQNLIYIKPKLSCEYICTLACHSSGIIAAI